MDNQPRVMQCSEVWGGNDEVDRGVAMPGMDAWVLSRPSAGEALGGDIHYVSSCATGRITRILLADVAGHGQAVAALAHRLRAIMRRFVNHVDQTRVAALINREFAALGEAGEFATAVVATFWGPTGEIDITNAGHPPPLFYSGRTAQWSYLNRNDDASGTDVPLGILDATMYTRRRVRLAPGDLLLLYTDALLEARGPDGSLLGFDRLAALAGEQDPARPVALVNGLYERVREFSGRESLDDDATILLLGRNESTRPRGSLRMGLRAIREMGREVWARVRGASPAIAWPETGVAAFLGVWIDRFNLKR